MGWSKLFGRREADAKAEPKAPPKPPPTPKPPEARARKAPGRRLSNTSSKRPAGAEIRIVFMHFVDMPPINTGCTIQDVSYVYSD